MAEEETVTPADDTVAKAEGEAAKPDDSADNDNGESKPEKKPWWQKRFDRFTAQNQALSRTNEALMAELANLRAGKTEEGGKSDLSEAEIDRRASAKAREIAQVKEFNKRCDNVYEQGTKEYDDFADVVQNLQRMGMMTPQFLELATELDDSHKVLYYLGKNEEEADRIQSMPSSRQALALAKLEAKLEKPAEKKVSKAPPPPKALDGKGGDGRAYASEYYDGMPQAEYNEWRDKTGRKRG